MKRPIRVKDITLPLYNGVEDTVFSPEYNVTKKVKKCEDGYIVFSNQEKVELAIQLAVISAFEKIINKSLQTLTTENETYLKFKKNQVYDTYLTVDITIYPEFFENYSVIIRELYYSDLEEFLNSPSNLYNLINVSEFHLKLLIRALTTVNMGIKQDQLTIIIRNLLDLIIGYFNLSSHDIIKKMNYDEILEKHLILV